MDTEAPAHTPALSVILPTDTSDTIAPVLQVLRRQTMAKEIEVLLVTPHPQDFVRVVQHESAFAALRVIAVPKLAPMGIPRAAGIRAATAPFIFVGETHSFLHPDAAQVLVDAASSGSWTAVVPGFENGNPTSALSWSSFIGAYSKWSVLLPESEIPEAPIYDCLYRRDVLLSLGDELIPMLSFGDDLKRALEARGHRIVQMPAARIGHVNLEKLWPWLHEHFLIGVMIGSRRGRQWSLARRALYIGGAGLIPLVLMKRSWPFARRVANASRLPAGTWPLLFLLFAAKAAGEVLGYCGSGTPAQEVAMNLYEIRRLDYVSALTRCTEPYLRLW